MPDSMLSPEEGERFISHWESFDVLGILSRFPASFIASLEIDWIAYGDEAPFIIAEMIKATIGDKAAAKVLKDKYGATDENIAGIKKVKFKKGISKEQLRGFAELCYQRPKFVRNVFLSAQIGDKLTDCGGRFSEIPEVDNELSGSLPGDIRNCLEAAGACVQAYAGLLLLTTPVFVRPRPIPVEQIERLLQRIKTSLSSLRKHLPSVAAEVIAASGQVVVIERKQFPSAFHAVLDLASEALDAVVLAGTASGRFIVVSQSHEFFRWMPSHNEEIRDLGLALQKTDLGHITVAMLQKEASVVAQRRLPEMPPKSGFQKRNDEPHQELKPHLRKALDKIVAAAKPMKGKAIANLLGISYDTFKKHYAPALKTHGLINGEDGYFVESR